jgi:hypothetical protein
MLGFELLDHMLGACLPFKEIISVFFWSSSAVFLSS